MQRPVFRHGAGGSVDSTMTPAAEGIRPVSLLYFPTQERPNALDHHFTSNVEGGTFV